LEIEYSQSNQKIYGIDRLITLKPKDNKKEVQFRSMDDYDFDFSKLIEAVKSDKIEKVRYYTELDFIKEALNGEKFEFMTL
jgi:CRISPR-associated protein Csh2